MTQPDTNLLRTNLRWAWHRPTRQAFETAGPEAFRAAKSSVYGTRASAPAAYAKAAKADLEAYLSARDTWGDDVVPSLRSRPVAYFSAEFGLHESIPIYSGGLGVLAGDHLKSASDIGAPLVAVGLFYREAYFQQRVDKDGQQHAEYSTTNREHVPLQEVKASDGSTLHVEVHTDKERIRARVWRLDVGRVPLYLLDADVEGCSDRDLTANLYGGGEHTRIRQELLLGVGGVKLLAALGIEPSVVHLNEGHSAFAALELTRQTQEDEGVSFEEASQRVRSRVVFTTHTPVEAGHDRFSSELAWSALSPLAAEIQKLDVLHSSKGKGPPKEAILGLGRVHPSNEEEPFCMTVLALRLSSKVNGVSALHGEVSRAMWGDVWPGRVRHDVPIRHITNGVHVPTWMGGEAATLLDAHLPTGWRQRQWDAAMWEGANAISDAKLIASADAQRARLVTFARKRAASDARRRGEDASIVSAMESALDAQALTIGFARRFATYKRANLILRDLELLQSLVAHAERPVQIIFAGKAHPKDIPGQAMLRDVFQATRNPRFLGKVLFLEDYDMEVGRELVAGCDVWLNNPRRPHEASGTSGQKVIYNGGLNCSILDGWWAEAYDGGNGFAIGGTKAHSDVNVQDERDRAALAEVMPKVSAMFYGDRSAWCQMVRRSIATMGPRFNTDRMVRDYVEQVYAPTAFATLAG
ncbi:MAG: starch phosphorylase [Polyangiales bacterium]|jgi:starch phosphorylase